MPRKRVKNRSNDRRREGKLNARRLDGQPKQKAGRKPGAQHVLLDPMGFAPVMRETMVARHRECQRIGVATGQPDSIPRTALETAMRLTGLHRATLSRLQRGTLASVGSDVLLGLSRLFANEHHAKLEAAFLTPEIRRVRDIYGRWLDRIESTVLASEYLSVRTQHGMTEVRYGSPKTAFLSKAQRRAEFVEMLRQTSPSLRQFERWLEKKRIDLRRKAIALAHVVDSFLDAEESAFVERGYDELTSSERERVLVYSIQREKIFLKRDGDWERIQEIANTSVL